MNITNLDIPKVTWDYWFNWDGNQTVTGKNSWICLICKAKNTWFKTNIMCKNEDFCCQYGPLDGPTILDDNWRCRNQLCRGPSHCFTCKEVLTRKN